METLYTVLAIVACVLLFSVAIFIHEFGHFEDWENGCVSDSSDFLKLFNKNKFLFRSLPTIIEV